MPTGRLLTHQFPYLMWGMGSLCVGRPGLCLPHPLPYLPVGSLGSGWSGSTLRQSQEHCKCRGCWLTLSGLLLLQEILDGHYTVVGQATGSRLFHGLAPCVGSLALPRRKGSTLAHFPSTVPLIHQYQNFSLP